MGSGKLSSSTASSLRTKLVKIFGKHRHFSTERLRPTAFGVIHYAGRVYYSTDVSAVQACTDVRICTRNTGNGAVFHVVCT